MSSTREVHQAARRSLLSVILTAVAITANHLYVLGPTAFLLGAVIVGLSTAMLLWFRSTKSRAALAGYVLLSLWVIAGFGLYKGLWRGTLPLFAGTALASLSTSFPKPALGSYGLTLEDLRTVIAQANVNQAKGNFDGGRQASTIGANDQIMSSSDYRALIVTYQNGAPVRLSDVANWAFPRRRRPSPSRLWRNASRPSPG